MTMMHLAILPNWNSLDSVRRVHSDLAGAALVFFALLVVAEALAHLTEDNKRKHILDTIGIVFFAVAILAEIAAYPFSQRNDTLSEKTIGSLDQKAKDADAKAQSALDKSASAKTTAGTAQTVAKAAGKGAAAAELQVKAVGKEADEIEYVLSARRVQDEDGLVNDLKAFKGNHMAFRSYFGDGEAYWLCSQLAQIAVKAEVDVKYECAMEPLSGLPATDLQVKAPSIDAATHLGRILMRPERVPGHFLGLNVAPEFTVLVGVKPSVPLLTKPKRGKQPNKQASSNPSAEP